MIFNRLARYGIIFLIIVISAVKLPFFYHKIIYKPSSGPRFYYSPIIKNFLYLTFENGSLNFFDSHGKSYTRREYEKLLPFQFYRDLTKWGVMPDSIDGFPIDISVIHHNNSKYRLKGREFDFPEIKLYPLFESESDFAQLRPPAEFFRIQDRIEFITASTNSVNEELSNKFQLALTKAGFDFPVKIIAGLPSTKKPFDEGYFLLDNSNHVFQMKKAKGEPVIIKTPIPADMNIRKIVIQETIRRKIYGFLVTAKNDIYMISYENYKLLPVLLENYTADSMDLSIYVDPFYSVFSYDDNTNFYSAAYDSNYNKIDDISISIQPGQDKISEKIKYIMFPFSISTSDSFSSMKQFDLAFHSSLSVIGIVLSLIIGLLIKLKRKEEIKTSWFDFVIIALTGIYGLIGVILIKTERWE